MGNETMTLDELIEGLRAQINPKHLENGVPDCGACTTIQENIEYIEEHRPALEAGMRGTLRFTKVGTLYSGHPLYRAVNEYNEDISFIADFLTDDCCRDVAVNLGLTAVFEEESDE